MLPSFVILVNGIQVSHLVPVHLLAVQINDPWSSFFTCLCVVPKRQEIESKDEARVIKKTFLICFTSNFGCFFLHTPSIRKTYLPSKMCHFFQNIFSFLKAQKTARFNDLS